MQMLLYRRSRVLDRVLFGCPFKWNSFLAPAIMVNRETVYDNIFVVNLVKLVPHMLN